MISARQAATPPMAPCLMHFLKNVNRRKIRVEQSSSDTNDEYGLGFEGHVTAGFSTPPCPRDCDSNSTTGCCIEGRFNVGVHNPPTEHSCGFFSQPDHHTSSCDVSELSSVLKGACTECFFIRQSISSLGTDLVATRASVQSNISHENADQVRGYLNQIRSCVDMLTSLARQIQLAYEIPLTDSQTFGGGVDESVYGSDILLYAIDKNLEFGHRVSNLHGQFEALHDSVVIDSSLPVGIPRDVSQSSPQHSPLLIHHGSGSPLQSSLPPQIETSSFWTLSSNMDVVDALNDRSKCKFEEHINQMGTLIKLQPQTHSEKTGWQDAHHFVSEKYVAKVYRISWDKNSKQSFRELSKALHECGATAFVCGKYQWFHDVFGVIFRETDDDAKQCTCSLLHICLIRTRLDCSELTAAQTSNAVVELLTRFGVMHGDGHVGNSKLRSDGSGVVELLDFERSFLTHSNDDSTIGMIRTYANDQKSRIELLEKWKTMGMEDTRHRFRRFVEKSHISNITMALLMSIFEGKQAY